jgi:hypothetical protein
MHRYVYNILSKLQHDNHNIHLTSTSNLSMAQNLSMPPGMRPPHPQKNASISKRPRDQCYITPGQYIS